MEHNDINLLEPELKVVSTMENHDGLSVSVVANYADDEETRFLLTPEACGLLTSAGINLMIETGAGVDISFGDEAYAEYGVKIVERDEALKAHVVLSYTPLRADDVKKMTRGAALLCMAGDSIYRRETIQAMLDMRITCAMLDNMYSFNDDAVFANIIYEIDGRAAILYAQEHLSYLGGGKGVLLAGVAGINPCEVLIIGEGKDCFAAAKAAMAAGASVTLLNNDISMLQAARRYCGDNLTTLAIHPRVLYNKCKTADVLILGTTTRPFEFPNKLNRVMKDSAFVMNFKDLHPSTSVPRTVAMALSNVLVNFFDEMVIKNGFENMVATTAGVRAGVVTFSGKLVDKLVASVVQLPAVELTMMLRAEN